MRKVMERMLLFAGLAGLAAWCWPFIGGAIYQRYQEYLLEKSMHASTDGAPFSGSNTAPAQDKGLIGRLEIPRLHVRSIVREGSSEKVLSLALGHIPGTALPGGSGNVGIAGHRDTLFRRLEDIGRGDLIVIQTPQGRYRYRVTSTTVVKPEMVNVLNPGKSRELTLVTCFPFHYIGPAPERFIVKARLEPRRAG